MTMWVRTAKIKRSCWTSWLLISPIILLIQVLQTLSGKLNGIVGSTWGIAGILILPGFLMIYLTVMQDKHRGRFLPISMARFLKNGTSVYLLVLLAGLLLEAPIIARSTHSIYDFRIQSLSWSLPLEMLILVGYWLAFYRRKAFFQPDQAAIQAMAADRVQMGGRERTEIEEKCLKLVAKAELDTAFKLYKNEIMETGLGDLNQLILLEGQFRENHKKMRLGLLTNDEGTTIKNRIMLAFIEMLEA